uniref:Protein tipE n=1 Tax=Lygus hesperus TaxID=30085 RepID=A0A0A9XCZ5_LYGHE
MAEQPVQTTKEKLLFYITASFILLAIFSLFAFLFLVPFVIEPAFTTIFMEFDETPAWCQTADIEHNRGMSNCSWTSCKEGCTKDVFECTQIRVHYKMADKAGSADGDEASRIVPRALREGAKRVARALHERSPRAIRDYDYPESYDRIPPEIEDDPTLPPEHGLAPNGSEWYYFKARLFPNVKGCGYPPMLNCTIWLKAHTPVGANFSCYYSRIEPSLVITDLDMWQVYMNLVYAIAIPIPSFIVSVIYLAIAYFYIYNDEPLLPEDTTPLPLSTPVPPPTSGALTPASEVFREDLASFGHQLKVAMADDISRDSLFTDSVPLSTNSINGYVNMLALVSENEEKRSSSVNDET